MRERPAGARRGWRRETSANRTLTALAWLAGAPDAATVGTHDVPTAVALAAGWRRGLRGALRAWNLNAAVSDDAFATASLADGWLRLGGIEDGVGARGRDERLEVGPAGWQRHAANWQRAGCQENRGTNPVEHLESHQMFPVAPYVVCFRLGQPATLDRAMH